MSEDIIGPVDRVTNVSVEFGPRMIMAGNELLGTCDNFSIVVAESTEEELEKLRSAYEIRLVKMLGEEGGMSEAVAQRPEDSTPRPG